MTKLASIATRSAATETTNSITDGSSLQQWRSIQGKHWLELQRLQHSIQQTLEQTGDPTRKLPARPPTFVWNNYGVESVYLTRHERPQQKVQCGNGNQQCAPVASQTSRQTSCSCAERRKQRTAKKRTH